MFKIYYMEMLDYDVVNSYKLTSDNYLFFDVFCRNDQLILIMPCYSDYKIAYQNIEIYYKDKELNLIAEFSRIDYERIHIKIFSLESEEQYVNIIIKYFKAELKFTLFNGKFSPKYKLIATTLFKDDYKYISLYYNYYKNQGVDFFYLYYNGIITKEIENQCLDRSIKLIEWNVPFKYKYHVIHRPNHHHAQLGQMHHALYKYGKIESDYIIFNDLDEYMHIPNCALREHINNNPENDYFIFLNYWSRIINFNMKRDVLEELPSQILKSNYNRPDNRCKFIGKTSKIDITYTHHPNYRPSDFINPNKNLMLLHFFEFTFNPNRQESILNEQFMLYDLNKGGYHIGEYYKSLSDSGEISQIKKIIIHILEKYRIVGKIKRFYFIFYWKCQRYYSQIKIRCCSPRDPK